MITTAFLRRELHFPKRSLAPHIVLAVFIVFIALFPRMPTPPGFGASKGGLARTAIFDYTKLAYPIWRRHNQDRPCPDTLRELNQYTSRKRVDDISDPWSGSFRMSCDERGLRVWSLGEDGYYATADDVRSWD